MQPSTGRTHSGLALQITGADKRYGGVHALKNVSLTVRPGQVVALVGENGAGKSTLVGVAAGRVVADMGTVEVDGREVGRGPAAATAAGIRLIPQELLLCPDMSVVDNVMLGYSGRRGALFYDRRGARHEAERRLARLGVNGLNLETPVGLLSVVQRTFVQIARGFTAEASVMLIDEPTAPMDNGEVESFLSVLQAITAEGIGIVYISHRLDEIFRFANRVNVMRDGAMVAEFETDSMTHESVIAAMVGTRTVRGDNATTHELGEVVLDVTDLTAPDVSGVSLELHQGELLGVYGISGSGREALGAAIVGASRRTGGSVKLKGRSLKVGSVAHAVTRGLGYVPAERRTLGLDLEASISANLTWPSLRKIAKYGFVLDRQIHALADEWVKRLSIKTRNNRDAIGTLSGGSQQKVLLARWLAARSDVLILEEPTRGVDVATKADIYALLHELTASGLAVLLLTSDIEEAERISARVLVVRNQRIAAELDNPTQDQLAHAAQSAKETEHA